MRFRERAAYIALSIALAGCRDTTAVFVSPLRVEPTQTRFAPGVQATFVYVNLSTFDIDVDACFPKLDMLTGTEWREVDYDMPNCGEVGLLVPAAGRRTTGVAAVLPAGLSSGTYRYRLRGARMRDGHDSPLAAEALVTAPFLVGP
jgi:hypothetical protein